MNVLLTGGAGYFGSHTMVELQKAGHQAVIVDDLSNVKAEVIDRIEKITGIRPAFFQIDCADRTQLKKPFSIVPIDAVIHFAGFKAVGESIHKPLQYYRNNLDSTLMLLEVMEEYWLQTLYLLFFGNGIRSEQPASLQRRNARHPIDQPIRLDESND